MSKGQKVIKNLAIVFAIFLIMSIIYNLMYGVSFLIKNENKDNNLFNLDVNMNKVINIDISSSNLIIKKGDLFKAETNNKYISVKQDSNRLYIKERKHGIFENSVKDLIVYIPDDINFDYVYINTGAGKIDIDSLKTDNLKFDLGAGKVVVNNLIVKNDAHIEGGAGTIDILDGSISNLDLEIGVGALSLTSKLLGDSKIECGVGKVDIKLLGKKDDYKFNFSKGLGSMSLNSINIDNDFIYGTGINVIDIEGGLGAIKVFVDE